MPPKKMPYNGVKLPWDDEEGDAWEDEAILKSNIVKVKKTHEYNFGAIKLIHVIDEESKRNHFKVLAHNRNDEITEDEAKILANLIQDIFKEEE